MIPLVDALLHHFAEDYPHIPVLRLVYDGNLQASERVRVEAFLHQARQAMEMATA